LERVRVRRVDVGMRTFARLAGTRPDRDERVPPQPAASARGLRALPARRVSKGSPCPPARRVSKGSPCRGIVRSSTFRSRRASNSQRLGSGRAAATQGADFCSDSTSPKRIAGSSCFVKPLRPGSVALRHGTAADAKRSGCGSPRLRHLSVSVRKIRSVPQCLLSASEPPHRPDVGPRRCAAERHRSVKHISIVKGIEFATSRLGTSRGYAGRRLLQRLDQPEANRREQLLRQTPATGVGRTTTRHGSRRKEVRMRISAPPSSQRLREKNPFRASVPPQRLRASAPQRLLSGLTWARVDARPRGIVRSSTFRSRRASNSQRLGSGRAAATQGADFCSDSTSPK
jgi:hypothetical protein